MKRILFIIRLITVISFMMTVIPMWAQHCCNVDHAVASNGDVYAHGELATLKMADGKLLLEMPLKYIGRELLISSCISRTTHYNWMAVGSRTHATHARLEYTGGNMYLKRINTDVVGNDADSLACCSLDDSNMDVYLAKLPVVETNTSRQSVTMDVTDVFVSDKTFSPFPWYFSKARTTLDKDLCRVMQCKAFDDNFSVRVLLSFQYTPKDDAPSGICSAEVVHSVLLLPEEKMRPRLADSRVGLFTQQKKSLDFTQSDFYRSISYAQRWRIEPSDWSAWERGDTVRPVKPITYYIDNSFPESWKAPLRKGILKWNEAFLRLRLKDVIAVHDYPVEDPDFDEDNLKYNCIRYVATDRGAAQGPSWADPSTGELLSASVFVWASLPEIMNRFCFVQTAQANPAIRSGRMSDEELSIALQCIITHEIGHTLGMAHNMGGSSAYPVDSLLNADFVRRNGLTASVMDYLYYNYIVPPETSGIPLATTNLGPYDELCLEYIYRPTDSSLSVVEDQKVAESWLDAHAGDPRYRYGIQQWGNRYDPTSLTDDISDDALEAGRLSIANLKYVLAHLEEWLEGGSNVTQRQDMYRELVKHYTSLLKHALYNVGGIRLNFVKEGTSGNVYQPVSRERQKEALRWVATELRSSSWLDNRELTSKFELAVDASADVQSKIAREIVDIAENVVLSSHLSDSPYTIREFADDLYELFFEIPSKGTSLLSADKVLQRALLAAIQKSVNPSKSAGKFPMDASAGLEDSETAFALRADGGYLSNVPVDKISEEKEYFYMLLEKVHDLSASKMRSASAEDKAYWTWLERALRMD